MPTMTNQIAALADMLPQKEQVLVYEIIRRMVLAWDPDFTKLTPDERQRLEEAEQEIARGETISDADINWD